MADNEKPGESKPDEGSAGKPDDSKPGEGAAGEDSAGKPDAKPDEKQSAKTYTQAELDRLIKKAATEAEKKALAAEAKLKLTEDQRLAAENEELKVALRSRDARDAITEALKKAGAQSPSLLFRSVEADLEFDAAGKLKNLDDVVAGLKTDFPEQFGERQKQTGSVDAGAGTKQESAPLTREKLAKMSAAEIAKLDWNDVKKALAAK